MRPEQQPIIFCIKDAPFDHVYVYANTVRQRGKGKCVPIGMNKLHRAADAAAYGSPAGNGAIEC